MVELALESSRSAAPCVNHFGTDFGAFDGCLSDQPQSDSNPMPGRGLRHLGSSTHPEGEPNKITLYGTYGGTSEAAPRTAGLMALILQAYPAKTPQQVFDFLVGGASLNKVSSVPAGTPNRLLYTRFF
jgi:subtilisin family serine protease